MVNQAGYDIEDYKKGLPSEAVYEICYCIKEKAALLKNNEEKYRWSSFLEEMGAAQRLYKENDLILQTALLALDILDEAIAPINVDNNLRTKYRDDMQKCIGEIESIIPELDKHPTLNEIYIRLSSYCFAIDEYDRCKKYYEKYKELGNFSIQHFAPWLRGKYTVLSIEVFVLNYLDIVDKIANSELSSKSEMVQIWFRDFKYRNGLYEALVLGRLWGAVTVPVALEMDTPVDINDSRINYKNIKKAWLVIPPLTLKIKANNREELFSEYNKETDGYLRFASIDSLGPDIEDDILHIVDMIKKELPDYLPSKEELNQLIEENGFDKVIPFFKEVTE